MINSLNARPFGRAFLSVISLPTLSYYTIQRDKLYRMEIDEK